MRPVISTSLLAIPYNPQTANYIKFDVGNRTVTVRTAYPGDISDRVLYGQMCLSPCDEIYSPSLNFHSPSYFDSNFTLQILNLDVDYSNEVMNTQTHT